MLTKLLNLIITKIKLAKNSLLPAFLLAAALLSFYFQKEFSANTLISLHVSFYVLTTISIAILLNFNKSRPVFFILTIALSYIAILLLRKNLGADFQNTPFYNNLSLLVPLNLIFFYFLPNRPLVNKENAYLLLFVFLEISLLELLSKKGISLDYKYLGYELLSLKVALFLTMNLCFFLFSSLDGEINSTAMFFAGLSVTLGFYYSADTSALTAFFTASLLILTLAIVKNIYHSTYKDVLTETDSRHSYILHSKKFPLKYAIGIISVDNYDKLLTVFAKSGANKLTKMIANKIKELEPETPVYRYNEDEFILVFKNETKDYGFEHIELIRKAIASSEFVLSRRTKPLKLTVSGSITEKKRSDANSVEALKRAKKALQNTNQFAQNFTSKA